MRKSFFISEVIGIALHRQPKSLCKDIVSGSWSFFSSFNIKLISFIAYSFSEIRISLEPHFRVSDFINGIKLIPPNGNMGIDVVTLKDVHQLHFDSVAASVTNRTFRADCNNDIVIHLGCTLLNSTDNVLSNVTGKPLINGCDLDL